MTEQELRTLELPVTLECDDGYYIDTMEKITITAIGKEKFLCVDRGGYEVSVSLFALKHYPSLKSQPRTVVFKEWLDKGLFKMNVLVTESGYMRDGKKHSCFGHFYKWTGYEIEVEVPHDWKGE